MLFHIVPVLAINITVSLIKARIKLETANASPEHLLLYVSKPFVLTIREMFWALVVVKISVEVPCEIQFRLVKSTVHFSGN